MWSLYFSNTIILNSCSKEFELNESVVQSTVSKMIFDGEIAASIDPSSKTVVVHKTEPSRLQTLALEVCTHMLPNQRTHTLCSLPRR